MGAYDWITADVEERSLFTWRLVTVFSLARFGVALTCVCVRYLPSNEFDGPNYASLIHVGRLASNTKISWCVNSVY